jgi:hypothetical protein
MSSFVKSKDGKLSSHSAGTSSQANGNPAPPINLSGEEQPIKIEREAVPTTSSEQTTTSQAPVTLSANDGQEKERDLCQLDEDSSTTDGGVKRTADEIGVQHGENPQKIKKKVDIRQPDVSLISKMCLNRNDSDAEAIIEFAEASTCLPSWNRICFVRQQTYQ